jgi:prefoldin subunit 5
MAKDQDAAAVAHLGQTVTAMREELSELRATQTAVLATLTALLAANEGQSEMLAEILRAARQEDGPSEVAQQLETLIAAVRLSAETVESLAEQMAALPDEISAAVTRGLPAGASARPAS